jgi:proteasome lid subunit RPN8/RPN11
VLLGKLTSGKRHVHAIVACRNTQLEEAHKRYEIDPAELVRVQRGARESGMEIVGFYHSHPDHPAQPSPTDLEHAHWIGCSYLITSVEHGKPGETRSFLLTGATEEDKGFMEESFILDQPPFSPASPFAKR